MNEQQRSAESLRMGMIPGGSCVAILTIPADAVNQESLLEACQGLGIKAYPPEGQAFSLLPMPGHMHYTVHYKHPTDLWRLGCTYQSLLNQR